MDRRRPSSVAPMRSRHFSRSPDWNRTRDGPVVIQRCWSWRPLLDWTTCRKPAACGRRYDQPGSTPFALTEPPDCILHGTLDVRNHPSVRDLRVSCSGDPDRVLLDNPRLVSLDGFDGLRRPMTSLPCATPVRPTWPHSPARVVWRHLLKHPARRVSHRHLDLLGATTAPVSSNLRSLSFCSIGGAARKRGRTRAPIDTRHRHRRRHHHTRPDGDGFPDVADCGPQTPPSTRARELQPHRRRLRWRTRQQSRGSHPLYIDADEDGFGDPESGFEGCRAGEGETTRPDDCDDHDPTVNPDRDEVCWTGRTTTATGSPDSADLRPPHHRGATARWPGGRRHLGTATARASTRGARCHHSVMALRTRIVAPAACSPVFPRCGRRARNRRRRRRCPRHRLSPTRRHR